MLHKSKKLMALILSVLMVISMLSAFVIPAVSAETDIEETVDPYAAINATDNGDGTWTPGENAVFVYAGAPATGDVTYTYGDGETWGDGKTYKLTGGKNVFGQMNAAIHFIEETWNEYDGPYSQYTGPDTVVVAPGNYGGSSWQNNKLPSFNLPRDDEGNVIDDPAYNELFTYTVLGPQAGKDPNPHTKADIAKGTLQNNRSTSTTTEAVSTSTLWMPKNAQIVVDGWAFRGQHNYHGSSDRVSLVIKNTLFIHDAIYSDGIYRWKTKTHNVNVEFHNYYMKYNQLSNGSTKDNLIGYTLRVTRLVMDNYYEYGGDLQYVSDQYNQAHMMNFYPTAYENIKPGFLGNGERYASFTLINSTLSHNRTAHWIRNRLDDAELANNPAGSLRYTIKNNYFYNSGDYCATDYKGSVAKEPNTIVDTISFQDAWVIPDGALTLDFEGNTMEYTSDVLARKTAASGNGFFMINANNAVLKQKFNFKNNTIILPPHGSSDSVSWSESTQYIDRSSTLFLNDKGEVMASGHKGNEDQMNDVYAGDDFQGGIVEMFTIEDGKDMALWCNVNATDYSTVSPTAPTADVIIMPYASEKSYPVKDLFKFRGDKVEFVGIYDKEGKEVSEAKPSELDGCTMVASYKGKTTVCNVTFRLKLVQDNQILFLDSSNSATSYNFNGKNYSLNSGNRVANIKDAVSKGTAYPFWIALPGTYDFDNSNATRIYARQVTLVGPKMGVAPVKDGVLDLSNRAITGTAAPYTVDTTKEAVINGAAIVYASQGSLRLDGVVCSNTFQFSPSDATVNWGYATGGCLLLCQQKNVFVNGVCNNNMIVGLGTAPTASSRAKRSFIAIDSAYTATDKSGCIVSSGLYDISLDGSYFAGGKGNLILTRMPAGKELKISPMACGFEMVDCTVENWGSAKGNWLYTNYVDYSTAKDWGRSLDCNGTYFPAGVHHIFKNNTFKNIGKAGCAEKGYALRLGIPSNMDNASLIFTGNTVIEDELTGYRFIDICGAPNMKLGTADVSGNIFINFSEPVRLGQSAADGRIVASLDENYFAVIEDGKEVVAPITAKESAFVTKSDWYYMDRAMTVKDTDFGFDLSEISVDYTVKTFPEFTVDAKALCGISSITADQIKGKEGMKIVGIYSDAACKYELTGDITANKFYVLTKKGDAEITFAFTLSKSDAHKWSEYENTLDPTCTETGLAERYCYNCSVVEEIEVAALGHVESEPTFVAPTCTENAGIYTLCLRCDEILGGNEIENTAMGHDWDEWEVAQEGDCTLDTINARTCKRCDVTETETIAAPGHTWGDWTVTTEPECEVDGVQTRICDVCATAEELPVTHKGHNFVEVTTEPTCVEEGKVEMICSVCDTVDEEQTLIIPATGNHTWGNVIHKDATCNAQGVNERFCVICQTPDSETREVIAIDPDAHSFDADEKDWVKVVEGTCLIPTTYERVCANGCGHKETKYDYTNTPGAHAYKEVITPATTDQTGKVEKVCSACGDTVLVKLLPRTTAFDDVKSGEWYVEYVNKAVAYGLIKGYDDNTVRPNANITRAEAVTIIARVAGVKTSKYSTNEFKDVAKGAWYNGAVAWAEQNKIVSGRSEDTFDPDGKINRQELCTVLFRYANFAGIKMEKKIAKNVFADDAQIAKYAKDAVYACQRAELVSGRPGNKFAPNGYATRAEVAKILVGFMDAYVK